MTPPTSILRTKVFQGPFSSQDLSLIDTILFLGRTWKNSAGTLIGTSGSNPVNVNTAGIIVDSLNADHGLMNQESQVVDSSGQIHAIISYVPGEYHCIASYSQS